MESKIEDFKNLLENEEKEKCINWALQQLDDGLSIIDLYMHVLSPALNSIECKERNEATCIWKEHVKTAIVRTIIEIAYPYVLKTREETCKGDKKQTVIILCPPNELHEIGARMISDFFTIAGYKTIFVGSNTPKVSFIAAIKAEKPKYVAISITNPYHIFKTHKIITEIRDAGQEGLEIIVGGSALADKPELVKQLGIDHHLNSYEDICRLGEM